MPKWKFFLFWFVLMSWRIGSALYLVYQDKEIDLGPKLNLEFWWGYSYLWAYSLYPTKKEQREGGFTDAMYCLYWIILIGVTGLAIEGLAWGLIRAFWGINVRYFWGEVFTVIFTTVCLVIPFRLSNQAEKLQEKI